MNIKKKDKYILVIGAGVSGLTTAVLLNSAGYRTRMISRTKPISVKPDPLFVSHYPSASVIPHSFFSDNAEKIFLSSRSVFNRLHDKKFSGLSRHPHFELFHRHREDSWYFRLMDNATDISLSEVPFKIPGNFNIETAWAYDCYFADWAVYYPALIDLYTKLGGTIEYTELSEADLSERSEEVIINCSELGSASLFPEIFSDMQLLAGHLLYISDPASKHFDQAKTLSYNITPPASVYGLDPDHTMDIYSYRRRDGWILGGSRIPATINHKMEIRSKFQELLHAESFPGQIFDMNREVILDHYGTDIRKLSDPVPKLSYRLSHPTENGLMIEQEFNHSKKIIHNVGHGGAGVTMSWGCSLEVLDLLNEGSTDRDEVLNGLFTHL